MDRKILGNRASSRVRSTGRSNGDGVEVSRAFLRIEKLRRSDAGFYRCRVDFRQAPTRNAKVRLSLIGESCF